MSPIPLICAILSIASFASVYSLVTEDDLRKAPSYSLSSYKFDDIIGMDRTIALDIVTSLMNIGAIEISNIPGFSEARSKALADLGSCLENEEGSDETTESFRGMQRRRACSAHSDNGIQGKMSGKCGENADKLRAVVDIATQQIFKAMDLWISTDSSSPSDVIGSYKTYSALFNSGDHFEHMNTLYASPSNSQTMESNAIEFKKDPSLMLALTSGYYVGEEPSDVAGLYIELPNGVKAKVSSPKTSSDSLILLAGEGSESWLAPVLGKPIRAAPYATISGLSSCKVPVTESWYAKEYFLPKGVNLKMGHTNIDFSSIRNSIISFWEDMNFNHFRGSRGLMTMSNDDSSSSDEYCIGDGVSMFMDGFTSIASKKKGSTQCINFLFVGWTLDNATKYAFACLGVISMGILIQFVSKLRIDLSEKKASKSSSTTTTTTTKSSILQENVLMVVYYAIQVTLSYFVMLLAMTYSVELFCMVCVGLIIGFALFQLKLPPAESADPCCQYVEEVEENVQVGEEVKSAMASNEISK